MNIKLLNSSQDKPPSMPDAAYSNKGIFSGWKAGSGIAFLFRWGKRPSSPPGHAQNESATATFSSGSKTTNKGSIFKHFKNIFFGKTQPQNSIRDLSVIEKTDQVTIEEINFHTMINPWTGDDSMKKAFENHLKEVIKPKNPNDSKELDQSLSKSKTQINNDLSRGSNYSFGSNNRRDEVLFSTQQTHGYDQEGAEEFEEKINNILPSERRRLTPQALTSLMKISHQGIFADLQSALRKCEGTYFIPLAAAAAAAPSFHFSYDNNNNAIILTTQKRDPKLTGFLYKKPNQEVCYYGIIDNPQDKKSSDLNIPYITTIELKIPITQEGNLGEITANTIKVDNDSLTQPIKPIISVIQNKNDKTHIEI